MFNIATVREYTRNGVNIFNGTILLANYVIHTPTSYNKCMSDIQTVNKNCLIYNKSTILSGYYCLQDKN